jgi:hypothetical protein
MKLEICRLKTLLTERTALDTLIKQATRTAFPIGTWVEFTKARHRLRGEIICYRFGGGDLQVRTPTGASHNVAISDWVPLPEPVNKGGTS